MIARFSWIRRLVEAGSFPASQLAPGGSDFHIGEKYRGSGDIPLLQLTFYIHARLSPYMPNFGEDSRAQRVMAR